MPHMRLKCTHQHGKVWRGVLLINSGENKKTSETVVDSLKFVWTSYKFNYNITTGGLLAHGQDFDESQSLEGAAQYCGWTRKYVKLTRNYRMFFLLQTCHWFIHKEVNAHEKHKRQNSKNAMENAASSSSFSIAHILSTESTSDTTEMRATPPELTSNALTLAERLAGKWEASSLFPSASLCTLVELLSSLLVVRRVSVI